MADADQTIDSAGHPDDAQSAPSGAETSSLVSQGEVVWILGDTVSNQESAADAHIPTSIESDLSAAVFPEAPANMDHALHQLTTVTDLFEVPVLDFGDHHF
jgi:hypothetical protein